MYGRDRITTQPDEAERLSRAVSREPAVVAARFHAGFRVLSREPRVDPTRIAAIGYCFGGTIVLDMARSGADLRAAVCFHGGLKTSRPAIRGQVKARVLVLTGGKDPKVPFEDLDAFRAEMQAADTDFEIVSYPEALHSFTDPKAGTFGMAHLAYDRAADEASWAAMLQLFAQVFEQGHSPSSPSR
jgi:dienelactone hydrolase